MTCTYLDGRNGVKDFDVWTFYAEHPDGPFPYRRVGRRDFGPSKLGRMPNDIRPYSGRRVDLIGRSLPVERDADPVAALRQYLAASRTASARALAAKAVVLIDPVQLRGVCVWPILPVRQTRQEQQQGDGIRGAARQTGPTAGRSSKMPAQVRR